MAVHDFKSQRLFIDMPIENGVAIEASREQANYLLNVLRLGEGSHILIFNGKDGEWQAAITPQGRKKCTLTPVQQTRTQPPSPNLTYCFAPLKQARLDYMIQKAVEMGVGVLKPVITQYTQVRSLNENRLKANAIEAAEQCGILSLPQILEPLSLTEMVSNLSEDDHIIFCDENSNHENPVAELVSRKPEKLTLLVGPEGGFSENEREMLEKLPHVTKLGLGPRILRADTAAVAALTVIQSNLGDWYT